MNLSIKRVVKNWKESSKIKFNKKDFIQNPISFGRRYSKQKPSKELWKKAFSEFNLIPEMYEPEIGNVLMNHYEDNACTHVHTDPAPKGYTHVRANVLLKKPKVLFLNGSQNLFYQLYLRFKHNKSVSMWLDSFLDNYLLAQK